MSDSNPQDTARRRDLLDAIGKASELHHHLLLVLVVLIGAQGIAAAMMEHANVLIFVSMIVTVATLAARLWVFNDTLKAVRMRLHPLLEGDEPTPDAKTQQELDWMTQMDPWLERISVWGLGIGAALFAAGCLV